MVNARTHDTLLPRSAIGYDGATPRRDEGMPMRNIVICSDGTGNTFDKSVSNVTRLMRLLALNDRTQQVVVYDQGIGTNAKRLAAVEHYRESIPDKASLVVLEGTRKWRFDPAGWPVRLFGLVGGYGLKANVREMYRELSHLVAEPDDQVFLFGFSRGAFTVRALAGLLYRCGLPSNGIVNFEARFEEAWRLYQPHHEDERAVAIFRSSHAMREDCVIHFLGLWDTVKSYGGVIPVSLPHLRHNPIVRTVRHALALHERRSWFNATTWGQLDSDKEGARRRLKADDLPRYEKQDIQEVWFRGCHSDIGGGDAEEVTARIALRWMLRESCAAGLVPNEDGKALLECEDPPGPATIHASLWGPWWLAELVPRMEIDNSGLYPVRRPAWGPTGRRSPDKLRRNGAVLFHPSVGVGIR